MIEVIVSDSQTLVREGCRYAVSSALDMKVTGWTSNVEETVEEVCIGDYDVAILGLMPSAIKALAVVRRLREEHPNLHVLVLGSPPAKLLGKQVLDAGGMGYLRKKANPRRLIEAIRTAAKGNLYVTPELSAALCKPSNLQEKSHYSALSERELQVVELIAFGRSTRYIAENLGISTKTVSTYRSRIREKIDVANDVETAHYALTHGIITYWMLENSASDGTLA